MGLFKRKRKPDEETENLKAFLDMIAPSIVKFETGYYICGNTFRCVWALREYPTQTDEQALLRHLGEKERLVIQLRYYHSLTQQRVAELIGVSQVQVSRIEKKALERLRTFF